MSKHLLGSFTHYLTFLTSNNATVSFYIDNTVGTTLSMPPVGLYLIKELTQVHKAINPKATHPSFNHSHSFFHPSLLIFGKFKVSDQCQQITDLPRWLSGIVSSCNSGDLGSSPVLGRFPGEGNGNPLQYSCLENPMDRGTWWAAVHGVTKESDTTYQLNDKPQWSKKVQYSMCMSCHFSFNSSIACFICISLCTVKGNL